MKLVKSMTRAATKLRMANLAEFYKRKYKKECIKPGETVEALQFSRELNKTTLIKKTGGQLMQQVKNSERNIHHILTGKGLLETFRKENAASGMMK